MANHLTQIIARYIEHPDHKRLADDPATSLRQVGLVHVALIGLALAIEEEFQIELRDDTIHAWHSIGCIYRTVREKAIGALIVGDADLVCEEKA